LHNKLQEKDMADSFEITRSNGRKAKLSRETVLRMARATVTAYESAEAKAKEFAEKYPTALKAEDLAVTFKSAAGGEELYKVCKAAIAAEEGE